MTPPLPTVPGGFEIIVADPPWRFASNSDAKPGRNARRHYDTMTVPEIAAMPVRGILAPRAILFLWITAPHLPGGIDVMRAWGFAYKSNIVWQKDSIGTGYWARNRHEQVLIGTRGRFPCPKPAPFPDSVFAAPKREHSRKPDFLQDLIDRTWPDARKLELFARQTRMGWASFGHETGKFSSSHGDRHEAGAA